MSQLARPHNDLETRPLKVALAGNPNAGKTSLFNALTGAHQRVGNYPGVTVEKREGRYRHDGRIAETVDLPGTYSLTSHSPEERIAQDVLLRETPDVVVVVADATALKRSMVILTQIMQICNRLVLCLNMSDEARRSGQRLDISQMEELLGLPVVETVGHKGEGVPELKAAISRVASSPPQKSRLVVGDLLESAIDAIVGQLESTGMQTPGVRWVAVKLLERDSGFVNRVRLQGEAGRLAIERADRERASIEAETSLDIGLYITERNFGFVDGLLREVTRQPARADARRVSDRVDEILVHRVLGLPFFLAAMYVLFWVTFTLGEHPMSWLEAAFGALGEAVANLWTAGSDSMLRDLLVDGIIGGVGGVLVFLPNILLLFLGLVIMEDTGYMARASFLVDRVMHKVGLHGRSFIPMISGFGCSIPGIMATRTLDNERDRLATMLIVPLMSCGARLPIWMLLIPAFFPPAWRAPALWLIYMVGILLALLLALVLKRSILKGDDAPFVMELPPYRIPTLKSVLMRVLQRAWLYVRKAGTLILSISIVMWFLLNFPKPTGLQVDMDIDAGRIVVIDNAVAGEVGAARHDAASRSSPTAEVITAQEAENLRATEAFASSAAGRIGRAMEPLIAPLGFDWKLGTAMIGAFAAKEVFVAQMGVIYSVGEADEESMELRDALHRDYSMLTGVSLMLFLLIATPCMATVAVMRRESGSWKWPLLQFGGLTAIAYLISLTVYQLGGFLAGWAGG